MILAHTHTCSIYPAIVGSTGGRLLLESSGVRSSPSIWCPPWLRNGYPWGLFSEYGTAKSHSERDPEITVVGWWQECFSRRGIDAQQAMWGSVPYRGAETTLCLPFVAPFPPKCIAQPLQKLAHRNDHHTLRISLRVTFGCSLLCKWASGGRVSQPWRTSNRMRRPNSGRFQKKPSAGAANNGGVDGASVCVCAQGSYFEGD